jgi:hypothetical protein
MEAQPRRRLSMALEKNKLKCMRELAAQTSQQHPKISSQDLAGCLGATTGGVEPRRHQSRGKASGCQHSARDTMVFIAGAAIAHQYGNAVGSNAELGARVSGLSIPLP